MQSPALSDLNLPDDGAGEQDISLSSVSVENEEADESKSEIKPKQKQHETMRDLYNITENLL